MIKKATLLGLFAALGFFAACSDPVGPSGPPMVTGDTITLESGLRYIDFRPGSGAEALPGDTATVHYTGWLEDGTQFDSSRAPNRNPLTFIVGTGRIPGSTGGVIAGFGEGPSGMHVGGRRRLIIPPELGYGAAGQPAAGIPGNATLIFDIELMQLRAANR